MLTAGGAGRCCPTVVSTASISEDGDRQPLGAGGRLCTDQVEHFPNERLFQQLLGHVLVEPVALEIWDESDQLRRRESSRRDSTAMSAELATIKLPVAQTEVVAIGFETVRLRAELQCQENTAAAPREPFNTTQAGCGVLLIQPRRSEALSGVG